jgi:two-component system NtrC family sensor kinase
MSPADPDQGPTSATVNGPAVSGEEEAGRAQAALMERPQLSIRTRVIVVFLVLFVLCTGITVAAVSFLSSVESSIVFLENASTYSLELEEARRNEKNFFLYGTGLPEALASASLSRTHLERDSIRIQHVVGPAAFAEMKRSIDRYQSLLRQLIAADRVGHQDGLQEIEVSLRTEGAKLLRDAQEMIDRERTQMSATLHTSRLAAVGFLAFMLFIMVLFGSYVLRAVLQPLDRFTQYMGRIGAGNFQPITPTRKYRDEFSHLALAFNQMISELKHRQNQLLESGRMAAVGTLTSGIAHELNNPLNNIGLSVEALTDDFDDLSDAEKRKMLEQIYTQVERASATVSNLLDFTRKGRAVFARLPVGNAVETAKRLVANEAKLANVEWNVQLPEDLPQVRGHPHDLQQVFLNLFLNAIQAMPDGGELRVLADAVDGEWVRIQVADTGRGIPAAQLPMIFDPFFTTKDPGTGTGLGLSVTHGIIEEHGGRIEVKSEEGRGATFLVFLPVAKEDVTA